VSNSDADQARGEATSLQNQLKSTQAQLDSGNATIRQEQ
jgi:hypothetical protein